jgi:hypothetical protein
VIDVLHSSQRAGCGTEGETVYFRSSGLYAVETATFDPGTPVSLSLTGPRMDVITLAEGCALLTNTYPYGTTAEQLRAAIAPSDSIESLWLWDTDQGDWDAYVPGVTMASDLRVVDAGDPLWLCMTGDATYIQPQR